MQNCKYSNHKNHLATDIVSEMKHIKLNNRAKSCHHKISSQYYQKRHQNCQKRISKNKSSYGVKILQIVPVKNWIDWILPKICDRIEINPKNKRIEIVEGTESKILFSFKNLKKAPKKGPSKNWTNAYTQQ